MDALSSILFVALLLVLGDSALGQGPCFQFHGNAFISFFSNAHFNNSDKAHYQLQFKTTSPNGIIMFSMGPYGDKEALYVRNGHLNYYLYNTASTGIGSEFGARFTTEERVDTGEWVTVHLYRSWVIPARPPQSPTIKTGLEFTMDGNTYIYTDDLERSGVNLTSTVYFGGYRQSLSSTVGYFQGEIRDIQELKNGIVFENPSLNYESKVGLGCPNDS